MFLSIQRIWISQIVEGTEKFQMLAIGAAEN